MLPFIIPLKAWGMMKICHEHSRDKDFNMLLKYDFKHCTAKAETLADMSILIGHLQAFFLILFIAFYFRRKKFEKIRKIIFFIDIFKGVLDVFKLQDWHFHCILCFVLRNMHLSWSKMFSCWVIPIDLHQILNIEF